MGKFLSKQDMRFFLSEGDLHIINLGYNDFSKPDLAPIHSARLQGYYTLHYVISGKGTLTFGGSAENMLVTWYDMMNSDGNIDNENNESRKKVVQKLATKQKRNPDPVEK